MKTNTTKEGGREKRPNVWRHFFVSVKQVNGFWKRLIYGERYLVTISDGQNQIQVTEYQDFSILTDKSMSEPLLIRRPL